MRFRPGSSLIRVVLVLALVVAAINLLALAVRYPLLAAVPLGVVAWKKLNRWQVSDAYGNARPAGYADLWQNGMLDADDGLFMGTCGYLEPPTPAEGLAALFSRKPAPLACRLFLAAFFGRGWGDGITIRDRNAIHTGIFGSTGSGKGVSVLIPNLLSSNRNTVTLDPQGSIFLASSETRRKRGYRIVRLDSSGLCGPGGDSMNPLLYINPKAPDFLEQVRDLVAMLVPRKGTEPDEHWLDSAERVLVAFTCLVCACESDPKHRNLLTVRAIVNSRDVYMATVNVMRQMTGVIKQQGDSLTWLQDKELNSVLSVVQRCTAWMDGPAVADCLRRSTFDPMELKHGRMSIYVIERPDRLITMAPYLRVTLGTILRVITRGRASEKTLVNFVIDETAALGRMQVLEDACTQLRAWGIRLILTFQSVGQLQKVYGDNAQTIADNLGTQLYFSTRSFDSLDHQSKLIGDTTITQRSVNDTSGHSHSTGPSAQPQPGNASTSVSVTTSETGRRWAKPEEIRTLPKDFGILITTNLNVITPRLIRYFDSPLFRHGRTGQSRELGLAVAVIGAGMMAFSLLLSAIVASLPAPAVRPVPPREQVFPQVRSGVGHRPAGPLWEVARPVSRPVPQRRNGQPGLPSRSGFLIRIPDPPRRGGPALPEATLRE